MVVIIILILVAIGIVIAFAVFVIATPVISLFVINNIFVVSVIIVMCQQ